MRWRSNGPEAQAQSGAGAIKVRASGELSRGGGVRSFRERQGIMPGSAWRTQAEEWPSVSRTVAVPHKSTTTGRRRSTLVRDYVLAWTALLDGGDPSLALCNTVEVQSLSGRTIGLIVLPTHPLRMAWHAAYDSLLLHAAFDEEQPPRKGSGRIS